MFAGLLHIDVDADFRHEAAQFRHQHDDAHRSGYRGRMRQNIIGRQRNVVAAGCRQVHHGDNDLHLPAFFKPHDFMINNITGGRCSPGGINLKNNRFNSGILFGQPELGDNFLKRGRLFDQALFRFIRNDAVDRNQQNLFSAAA